MILGIFLDSGFKTPLESSLNSSRGLQSKKQLVAEFTKVPSGSFSTDSMHVMKHLASLETCSRVRLHFVYGIVSI